MSRAINDWIAFGSAVLDRPRKQTRERGAYSIGTRCASAPGHRSVHGRNVGTGYFIELQLMQRPRISQEIADSIDVSTWSPTRPVVFEIFLGNNLKNVRCCSFGLSPGACRVLAEFGAGVKLFCDLADMIDVALGCHAEAHAPLFGPKRILKDKRP